MLHAFVRDAASTPTAGGPHRRDHVVDLPPDVARIVGGQAGAPVTVRIRRSGALPAVIRTWREEKAVQNAVRAVLPHTPRCLAEGPGFAVHSHVPGEALSALCGNGKPVDALLVESLTTLLARLTQVRASALPPLPSAWPANHTDSRAFLRTLARLADEQIRRPNWAVFGGLFTALGIPADALSALAERVPPMMRRPYSLLHTDLRRDNLVVRDPDGDASVVCVDWGSATYGDPLHDLATHLVRMRYPRHQEQEVTEAWARAMRHVRPAAVNGLAKDLDHYLAFERAQSVYPDVMRAARSLERSFTQESLEEATAEVHRAVLAAAEPLRLSRVPNSVEIEGALFRWLASRGLDDIGGRHRGAGTFDWKPDPRLPEHPDFPASAVRDALLAEGAAPAGRVVKGTAHLNSVVRVPGVEFPVVVRRRLRDVCRREPSFLSEHAVLRAIEDSGVEVAAPRVLALGTDFTGDAFAVHTYVGPWDVDLRPVHPVNGLRPHEADALVDQLCALTGVNHESVDPAAGQGGFHAWLTGQLVALVRDLPRDSMRLARSLGLPDHQRLGEILSRHTVTDRVPALLHGDLNPWNLVCRDDALGLTIIDWEMALVGDPLYDLVRHMHLTPNRQEIRERMVRRWERRLPPEYTRDWRRDWRVYRCVEIVRSAYIDLDRLVTGAALDAPNVRRAVDSYASTLVAATTALGLPVPPTTNPYTARARVRTADA
ncbi:aminoglycoside phosphotransferase family protein [Streptomyces sp. NPDC002132]|uniref:phosphotransferase family protein n=1 Tax=unclassified Streptomyces TaxID=2593676 RepID=UPI003321C3DA